MKKEKKKRRSMIINLICDNITLGHRTTYTINYLSIKFQSLVLNSSILETLLFSDIVFVAIVYIDVQINVTIVSFIDICVICYLFHVEFNRKSFIAFFIISTFDIILVINK